MRIPGMPMIPPARQKAVRQAKAQAPLPASKAPRPRQNKHYHPDEGPPELRWTLGRPSGSGSASKSSRRAQPVAKEGDSEDEMLVRRRSGLLLGCVSMRSYASGSTLRYHNPPRRPRHLRLDCAGRPSGPGRYRRPTRLVLLESELILPDNATPVYAHFLPAQRPRPPRLPRSLSRPLVERSASALRRPL